MPYANREEEDAFEAVGAMLSINRLVRNLLNQPDTSPEVRGVLEGIAALCWLEPEPDVDINWDEL